MSKLNEYQASQDRQLFTMPTLTCHGSTSMDEVSSTDRVKAASINALAN